MATTYLITLTDNSAAALETIKQTWPDGYYPISDNLIMVSVKGVSTPSQIAEKVGIKIEGTSFGLVLSMNKATAAGVLPSDVVDWIKSAENA